MPSADAKQAIMLLLAFATGTGSLAWAGLASAESSAKPKHARVLALDCEIPIPAEYVIQTQDSNSVAFFATGIHENARVVITNDEGEGKTTAELRTIEKRRAGHLEVKRQEFLGFPGSTRRRTFPLTVIRSRAQRLTLYADATKLEESIVESCLKTIDPAKARTYERRRAGCAYELKLRPGFDFVFEEAEFTTIFTDGDFNAWELQQVKEGGFLSKGGVQDGDRITHICGVPLAETFGTGGSICCSSGDPQSLLLKIERGRGSSFEVVVPPGGE